MHNAYFNPRKTMAASTPLTLKTANGTQIFTQTWTPVQVRGVAILCHGLGEHSGRYEHVAAHFNSFGIALLGYDHTGHGRSGGNRGHVPAYAQLMEELDLVFDLAHTSFPGLPIFLYGHSWGGNISLNYLIRQQPPVQAAIITGPWLLLPQSPPALQVFFGKLVKGIFPGFAQNTGLAANLVSRDPKEVEKYQKDPLVHGKISAATFFDTRDAAAFALERASEVKVPTLLMHGGKDGITDPEGSRRFAAQNPSHVTLKIWDGYYHELHNDIGKEEVLTTMSDFLTPYL
jgi:alpha-beta hydrolase superfamily lysophospholipase